MTNWTSETPIDELSSEFQSSGYAVVRAAFPPSTVEKLRSALSAAATNSTPDYDGLQQIFPRLVEIDDSFVEAAVDRRLLSILTGIFGGVPQLVCSYGHVKPALTDAHTVLHSDVAHLRGVSHTSSLLLVKVAISLTRVRPDSGPTLLYPGSHTNQIVKGPRLILMEPGDMLMFHANIRHSATANRSSSPRLGIWFVFGQPWMRIFPGYEYSQEFMARVRPRFEGRPELEQVFGLPDPYATR